MIKQLSIFFLLLLSTLAANAADNSISVTVGSGPTLRSVDIGGGVQAPGHVIVNSAGTNIVGAGTTLPVSSATFGTAANQTTINTSLTTINTTLGSPFQAGASIGNTTFAATQATAASLNATVVGTGTFAAQVTGSVTANAGTNLNTSALATSANQTNAGQKTQIVDGSGNVIASTSNNLNVQCANCSGSGVSAADAAVFTAGTSLFAPVGGQFTSGGATACVTGHECTVGMTAARAMFGDTSSIAGTTTLTGNGTAGAGAQRVTIASDNTAFSVNATIQASANLIGKVGIDQTTVGTTNAVSLAQIGTATILAGTGAVGTGAQRVAIGTDTATIAGSAPSTVLQQNAAQYLGAAVVANPCLTGTIVYIPISQATSTQVASLGGSSKKNYICAIDLVAADAENISVVEGTGSVCATTTAAIMGGTTAANGWNFAANSGIAKGNGAAPVAAGSLTSLNNVCLLQSGSGRVAGSIVLAQQ